jgi:phosphohistidine phosphatase
MKRIVLIRHVNSPHPAGVDDYDRPINAAGRRDAGLVAERLVELDWVPETVVSSGARRARQTWKALETGLEGEFDVSHTDDLYQADVDDICEVVWGLDDGVEAVMLFGHNPGFSRATSWLTGVRTQMPKGSAALVECDGESWSEAVQQNACRLEEFIRPKALLG